MASTVTILVDHGERSSGVPAHLRCLGIHVEYRALAAGDYVIEGSTVVERKAIPDLHRSLATGRLRRQIGALRSSFTVRYLLLEGRDVYAGSLSPPGLRGALLAVAASDVRLVWARGARDSAEWLHAIAARAAGAGRERRSRRRSVQTPASLLAHVPGVSPAIAADLLRTFGPIAAVAQADDKDLLAVRRLGRVRVAASKSLLALGLSAKRKVPLPGRALRLRTNLTGGVRVAGSDRAVPRHLGGNP